jgi:nucleoid DNA-binding protein
MANLTKREIVLEIFRKTGFPQKQIVETVQMTLDHMQNALAANRNVELRNFGVLEVQLRKQRVGRNPNKPEATVIIPNRAVVKFKAGKILKQQLKKIDLSKLTEPELKRLRVLFGRIKTRFESANPRFDT